MNGIQKAIKIGAICFAVFIITSIVGSMSFVLSFIPGVKKEVNTIDFTEKYNNINNIEIELTTAKLYIKEGNEFKVEAYNITENFISKSDENILKIKEEKKFYQNNKTANITIYIPKDYTLDELVIESGVGKIELIKTFAKYFYIRQGVGDLIIRNSEFNETNINGGVGSIKVYDSQLNDLKLNAGVGDVKIESEISGNSHIESGIGSLELLLNNESQYQLEITKGLGKLRINDNKINDNLTYGNGINKIKIDSGIGDIKINFHR